MINPIAVKAQQDYRIMAAVDEGIEHETSQRS